MVVVVVVVVVAAAVVVVVVVILPYVRGDARCVLSLNLTCPWVLHS